MSVRQMGLVWELDLPKPEKFLLLALADHADHNGRGARPGVALLAWKTGDNRRTVQRNLRKLEARGLIVIVRHGGGLIPRPGAGRVGAATEYRLQLWNGDKLTPYRDDETDDEDAESYPPENPQGRHHARETAAPGARNGDTNAAPTIKNHQEPVVGAAPVENVGDNTGPP